VSRVNVEVATAENEDVGGSELDVCDKKERKERSVEERKGGSTRLTVDEVQIWARDIHSCDQSLARYIEEVRFLSVEASDEESWVNESLKEKRRRETMISFRSTLLLRNA